MVLALPNPCVVSMIGAASSGKSTLAAALATSNPDIKVVSYDEHQLRQPGDHGWQTCTPEAIATAHIELAERCTTATTSIVDGTHSQPERRAAVRAIATIDGLPVIAVVLVVPLEECLNRQRPRTRSVVPEDIRAQRAAISQALPGLHRDGYTTVIILNQMPHCTRPIGEGHRTLATNPPTAEKASGDVATARAIEGERERIARELEAVEEFCKDYTLETGEVLIPRDVAVEIARTGGGRTRTQGTSVHGSSAVGERCAE